MAFITADGVGIRMPEISSAARVRPLASMMRFKKISRIFFCADSMFSTPKRGMTFSQT